MRGHGLWSADARSTVEGFWPIQCLSKLLLFAVHHHMAASSTLKDRNFPSRLLTSSVRSHTILVQTRCYNSKVTIKENIIKIINQKNLYKPECKHWPSSFVKSLPNKYNVWLDWKPVIQGPLSLSGYDYVTVDLKAETDKWKFSCGRCEQRTNTSCTLNLAPYPCSSLSVPSHQPCNHNNFSALNARIPPFIVPAGSLLKTHRHTCMLVLFVKA